MDRRHFIVSSAAALTAASSTFGAPSDTVRVAVIGVGGSVNVNGGRGKLHLASYAKLPNVEVAAVCDIDEAHLNYGADLIEKSTGKRPKTYQDIRKLYDDKSIDAVSIATPNHWHTLATVWACKAGKDVYVEKPCSHNMYESQQIVAAAHKYNRIVTQGSQIRSSVAVKDGIRKLHEGLIGDVYLARGLCFKWRDTIGRTPVSAVPAGVDYDIWQGPAQKHDFTRNRFHYNWHWFWDYGNGDLGNQGIHQVDIARWGLGVKYPVKVSAVGGHYMFDDDQQTPNVLNCAYEFADNGKRQLMEFEVRHWMTHGEASVPDIGNIFYGSNGYMAVDSYTSYKSWLGRKHEPGPEANEGGDHFANFIGAVRSRKPEDLNCPIEDAAISCTLVHLANISYRVGRTLNFDAKTYSVVGDPEANRLFTRNYRDPFVVKV